MTPARDPTHASSWRREPAAWDFGGSCVLLTVPRPDRMPERITEEQLRRIYADTIDTLYGYTSRRCGGQRELAEDVTQEVWLRAVRDWRRTGSPDNPLAWLTTVARNLILNHLRRREG